MRRLQLFFNCILYFWAILPSITANTIIYFFICFLTHVLTHECCPADSLMSINDFPFSYAIGLFILYRKESKIFFLDIFHNIFFIRTYLV